MAVRYQETRRRPHVGSGTEKVDIAQEATNATALEATCATLDEFRRKGVFVLTRNETDGSEMPCFGTLTLRSATWGIGPVLKWVPNGKKEKSSVERNGQGGGDAVYGSLNDLEWALVDSVMGYFNDAPGDRSSQSVDACNFKKSESFITPEPPISIELSKLKSFKLNNAGNSITLMEENGTTHPPLFIGNEDVGLLMDALGKHYCVKQSVSDRNLYLLKDARTEALDQSFSQLDLFDKRHKGVVWKFVNDFQKDTYATAMTTFSKITDMLLSSTVDGDNSRPDSEVADDIIHHLGSSNLDVTTGKREEGGFEVVTPRPRIMDNLPKVVRTGPLCQLDWELHFENDGTVIEKEKLKDKIFRGGIDSCVRQEAWKFLLSFYRWESNYEERARVLRTKELDYKRMKNQWQSMSQDQEDRFSAFRECKCQIERDVTRTDRDQAFLEGESNPNVRILQEILMTYAMYNFDLGYVQGMSDLLSPILYVMQNEVEAFWCFVGFMDRVSANFEFEKGGVKNQLSDLREILRSLDPEFYAYLVARECENLFFCFRWLLIWFKRELAFEQVQKLWEILWTGLPCRNFPLLMCLALLESEKSSIVENNFGFNEILKHINDMANRIDLDLVLQQAEGIWLKLCRQDSFQVSDVVSRLLGLDEHHATAAAVSNSFSVGGARPVPMTTPSKPMDIANSGGQRSSSRLSISPSSEGCNDSSSIEVLSEPDEDAKFKDSLSAFSPI